MDVNRIGMSNLFLCLCLGGESGWMDVRVPPNAQTTRHIRGAAFSSGVNTPYDAYIRRASRAARPWRRRASGAC